MRKYVAIAGNDNNSDLIVLGVCSSAEEAAKKTRADMVEMVSEILGPDHKIDWDDSEHMSCAYESPDGCFIYSMYDGEYSIYDGVSRNEMNYWGTVLPLEIELSEEDKKALNDVR